MIEVRQLTKHFGSLAAIQEISFDVPQGEIVGFLGPNGAGKSTTMRILTGFSTATRGTARVGGFEVHEEPLEVKRRVGYLPERVPLYEEMVVTGFLRYVAEVKGVEGRARGAEVDRVVERCGLGEMRNRLIGHLSKGYRQRVGLAQALIGAPPVLILDEPTVGLDPKQIVDIRQMIKDLRGEHTILLSTHILPEVAMVCDRVIIIDRGRVVAEDTMEHLSGGDKERWVVEVSGDAKKALGVLKTTDGALEVVEEAPGHYVVMMQRAEGAGAAISGGLTEAGLVVTRLSPQRQSLEEVFMSALSREREGAA